MNVNDFEKNISNYLDGSLKPSKMKEFEELLKNNIECKEKLNSYKKMLKELSMLEDLSTSDNFMNELNKKINIANQPKIIDKIQKINFFGYDYISISGIAAALIMFIFSITIFTQSDNIPVVNLDKLSTKNIKKNPVVEDDFQMLTEDDSLDSNLRTNLPIQLIGCKK